MTDEEARAFEEQLRVAIAPMIPGEEILAAGAFRYGGMATGMALSHLSGVAAIAHGMLRKRQAGGLPGMVLLAVTPQRLYAFSFKQAKWTPKEQVAMWERADLEISTEVKLGLTNLTIASPREGERATLVPISVTDDLVSLKVITMLAEAHPAPAGG